MCQNVSQARDGHGEVTRSLFLATENNQFATQGAEKHAGIDTSCMIFDASCTRFAFFR